MKGQITAIYRHLTGYVTQNYCHVEIINGSLIKKKTAFACLRGIFISNSLYY